MKKTTINVLVVIALFTGIMFTSCLKSKNEVTPAPTLSGNYDGVLKKLKKNAVGKFDTVFKFGVSIRLKADSGYTLVSDSAIHANSNGKYANDFSYAQFEDKTYTNGSTRLHLSGLYAFYYDGSRLQFLAPKGDTVAYLYDLRKTGN